MDKIKIFLMTLLIRTIGRLSTGINLSFKYGFISGYMLEYIYENKPHGRLLIGKLIDRAFLNNIGWQAIRQRKENLKKYLKEAILENRRNVKKTLVLDIASGPAKYILEVLLEVGEQDIYVVCQDIDQRWLDYGREQADRLGLKNIRFEKGDAFNLELLSKVTPKPNVVVSSGFYDWITDDELVKKSFNYCYSVLSTGGKIIFTNQAAHQQMELVQAAFVDFNKEPLRMKTRLADLICGWAKESGFRNLSTLIDRWGFYSVSKGEK
jgi:ubiquinone/menaquinone biosynthesis C-methylase UbiE